MLDRKSTMTQFGPLADIDTSEEIKIAGAGKTDKSLRLLSDSLKCQCVTVSPAGNEFAIATPEGVSVYSKNSNYFQPINLTESATPKNFLLNLANGDFGYALNMALTLSEG